MRSAGAAATIARVSDPSRGAYLAETSQWPVVHLTPVSDFDFDVHGETAYGDFEGLLARCRPFMTLFDVRGVRSDAGRRRRLAAWVNAHAPELRQYWVAQAVLVDSGFERGLYTAMLWLVRPPCPVRAFDDEADARAWLEACWRERHA